MKNLLLIFFALPTLVLVFWAGWYLRGYFDALDDSYFGLTFTYAGAKGPVEGRADKLNVDWRSGKVRAEGVTLTQLGAPSAVRVDQLEAVIPLPWTVGETYSLQVNGGSLEVVRYSGGSWSFQDFAPAAEEEPSEPAPIEVTASNVRVRFHDRFVRNATTWNLATKDLRVGVIGSDAAVAFRGDVEGVGTISATLDLVDGSVRFMNVSGQDINILPAKQYFAQWPGLKDSAALSWTADKGVFSGKVTARPSASGDWLIRGEGEAAGSNLVVDGKRFASARFVGSFTENGAGGRIVATAKGMQADGVGYVSFGESFAAKVEGTASAVSAASLEALFSDLLPADVDFRGATFDGVVSLGGDMALSGKLAADSVKYGDYSATGVSARLASDGKVLRVMEGRGRALGGNIQANLAIALVADPRIEGVVIAPSLDLMSVPGVPKDVVLGGKADVKALISGRVSALTASVRATGNTTLLAQFQNESVPHDVEFEAVGDYRQGVLELSHVDVGGELGGLRGSGTVDLKRSSMDLKMFASGVDLSALPGTGIAGTAYGDLHVTGTTSDPKINGLVEVYGGRVDDYVLPFASGRIDFRNGVLLADEVVARLGVSVLEGSGKIDTRPTDWNLSGQGTIADLMLDEFTQDRVTGLASGTWKLEGTASDPQADVNLSATTLVADRIEIRDVLASARWQDDAMTIGSFSAAIGGGKLTGEGSWKREGESAIRASLNDVSTWALRPYLEGVARLGGRISGDAEVSFLDGAILRGSGYVAGRELEINREPIGGATISAEADPNEIRFSAGLGTLDSNYVIENGVYSIADKKAQFDYYALGGDVETIMRVVASLAQDAPVEQQQLMRQIAGSLTLEGAVQLAEIDGMWKVSGGKADARVANIVFDGQPSGDVRFVASKQGERFNLETVEWTGPQAAFRLNPGENYIDESGTLSLSGDIYNIDLNWFKSIRPELATLSGRADASFVAGGKIGQPEIDVTVATEGLKYGDIALDFTAGPFSIREGAITAGDVTGTDPSDPGAGYVRIRDLEARLVGVIIPFNYPASIPKDKPISALLIVPDREIRQVSDFLGIDPEASEGQLKGGRIEVKGSLDALQTTGGITLDAPRLKFSAADTALVNANIRAELSGSTVHVTASADSEAGGDLRAGLAFAFDGMAIEEGSHIYATGLKFAQRFGADSRASGLIDADLQLSGNVFEPFVEGTVIATNAAMRMAGEFPAAEGQGLLPIHPVFDVALELRDGQVANGPLEAQTSGSGWMRGPLSVLDARMNFTVDSGDLNLPSTRIRLERGGVATFTYTKNFEGISEAALNVNLNATTRVTADGGLGPQRYEISLEIRGDLLSDDELDIQASSDPPDLTESQILAILGQKDIIENVASVGFGNFEGQLKSLLSSVAAPLLLGQVTRQIERALGLDYFSVDFAGSGIGGLTVAKALGNGFTVEYRRIMEQYALAGESLDEVKLTYRLPTSNPILGRFTVGLALNGEGLFKATLSYTRRF